MEWRHGRVHMLPVWQEKPDRAAYGAQGFGQWINTVLTGGLVASLAFEEIYSLKENAVLGMCNLVMFSSSEIFEEPGLL